MCWSDHHVAEIERRKYEDDFWDALIVLNKTSLFACWFQKAKPSMKK